MLETISTDITFVAYVIYLFYFWKEVKKSVDANKKESKGET